jgi:hypothetical protein
MFITFEPQVNNNSYEKKEPVGRFAGFKAIHRDIANYVASLLSSDWFQHVQEPHMGKSSHIPLF